MKKITLQKGGKGKTVAIAATAAAALLALAACGLSVALDRLEKICERQCILTDAGEQVEISLKYEGYLKKQQAQIAKTRAMENWLLPEGFDYSAIEGLRLEARQKLTRQQPRSLGQAGRISGVSPADVGALMVYLSHREEPTT